MILLLFILIGHDPVVDVEGHDLVQDLVVGLARDTEDVLDPDQGQDDLVQEIASVDQNQAPGEDQGHDREAGEDLVLENLARSRDPNHLAKPTAKKTAGDQKTEIRKRTQTQKRKSQRIKIEEDQDRILDRGIDRDHAIERDHDPKKGRDQDHAGGVVENQQVREVLEEEVGQGNRRIPEIKSVRRRKRKKRISMTRRKILIQLRRFRGIMMKKKRVLIQKKMLIRMGKVKIMNQLMKVHRILEIDKKRILRRSLIIWIFQILLKNLKTTFFVLYNFCLVWTSCFANIKSRLLYVRIKNT